MVTSRRKMTVDAWVPIVRAGLKESTARSWSTYLNRIAEEFEGRPLGSVMSPEIEGLREKVIREAMRRSVSRQGASAGEGLVAAARAVWARAVSSGLVDVNPASGVDKPKRSRARDRRAMTHVEIDELWNLLATHTRDPALSVLVLRLALESGMRRGEMLGLTYGSLELASGCLRVSTGAKNYSTRQVPITDRLFRTLDAFVVDRAKVGSKPKKDTALLLNARGLPITRRWFEGTAARVRSDSLVFGEDGDLWFTWHLTRHTAGKMIERAAGYSVAQKFLGHEPNSLSGTTVLYTQATVDEVRKAMAIVWDEPMAGLAN